MTKLFVGSLSFQTNEQDLLELFSRYGNVESAKLVTDRDSGMSRGFAFVEMGDADAQSAIKALDQSTLNGRTINVNVARPKESSGGGNRGGGGGRGGNNRYSGSRSQRW